MADKIITLSGGFKRFFRIAECVGTDTEFTMLSDGVPCYWTSYAINNYGTIGNKYKYTDLTLNEWKNNRTGETIFKYYDIGAPRNESGIPTPSLNIFTQYNHVYTISGGKKRNYDATATDSDHFDLCLSRFVNIVHNTSTGNYLCAPVVIEIVDEYTGYGSAVFAPRYNVRVLAKGESTSSYPAFKGNITNLETGQWSKSWGYQVGDILLVYASLFWSGTVSNLTKYINGIGAYDDLGNPPSYPDDPDPDEPDPDDPTPNPDDPDEPNDDEPGDNDKTSDEEETPTPPNRFSSFTTLWHIDDFNRVQLAEYMWSEDYFNNISKVLSNPFDVIISYKRFYYVNGGNPSLQPIALGNIKNTGVKGYKIDQLQKTNTFTYTFNEFFGSFMDYSPYTKIKIYLPFCGVKELDTDLVMGGTITLELWVDFQTGSCVWYVSVARSKMGTDFNGHVYTFEGVCAVDIPVTGSQAPMINSLMNTFKGGNLLSQWVGNNTFGAVGAGLNTVVADKIPTFNNDIANFASGISNTASGIPIISKFAPKETFNYFSTPVGSGTCMFTNPNVYVLIERPIPSIPSSYSRQYGVPCNVECNVGSLTGYAIFATIHADRIIGTLDETNEIVSMLQSGIIVG